MWTALACLEPCSQCTLLSMLAPSRQHTTACLHVSALRVHKGPLLSALCPVHASCQLILCVLRWFADLKKVGGALSCIGEGVVWTLRSPLGWLAVELTAPNVTNNERTNERTAAATQLAEVQQQAVAHFWELLGDFVALSAAPQSWLPQISPSHPFLHVTGDQVLCVHRIAVDQSAD